MTKNFALNLIFIFSFSSVFGSDENKSDNQISLGYGAGVFTDNLLFYQNSYAQYQFNPTGPFYLKYDHKLNENIRTGINFAWLKSEYEFTYIDTLNILYHVSEKHEDYSVMLHFNFSIYKTNSFNLYYGIGVGYRNHNSRFRNEANGYYILESVRPEFPFAFEMTVGERLFFTDHLGIYVEVGIAKSVFQGGITYGF